VSDFTKTENYARALRQVGQQIEVHHRYFNGLQWAEEVLHGTLTKVDRARDGSPYGRFEQTGGGGYDCYVDSQGFWRHGR
jgi:hypothetical protein